jgi:hypothetical protein
MDDETLNGLRKQSKALNKWLQQNIKRHRRLNLSGAWIDSQKAKLRYRIFGHY